MNGLYEARCKMIRAKNSGNIRAYRDAKKGVITEIKNVKVALLKPYELNAKCDSPRKRYYWKAYCYRCGKVFTVREDNLKEQKSCGCLSKGYRARYLHLKGR